MDRIVLLDLNYTLVANSAELGYPHHDRLHIEEYRVTLVRMLLDHYVILITVRPEQYKDATLKRIRDYMDWQPNEAYFNPWSLPAPACKRRIVTESIIPKHGANPALYWAIESNEQTREMYTTLGIKANHYRELVSLPKPSPRPAPPTLF